MLVETRRRDIWKRVEGPLRPRAAHARDLVDAVDDQVATVLEDLHHPAHGVLGFRRAEGLDRGDLREGGGAR